MIALSLLLTVSASQPGWPAFRGGPTNTGRSPVAVRSYQAAGPRRPQTFDTGGLIWGTAVVDALGNTYVGAANKRFYALDPQSRERWHYDVSDRADALIDSAAVLASGNMVVVPGGDGFLHALDRDSGKLKWRFAAHHVSDEAQRQGAIVNSFEGNVQAGPDGRLYAGCDNGALYALDGAGKERWSYRTGMMVWSSPCFDPAGRWLAFGSLDGHLYLLDPATGKLLDRFAAGGEVKSSPVLDDRGRLVFGTSQGRVWALGVGPDLKLHEAWHFDAGAEVYASPALAGDGVVFGALDGRVYALDGAGRQRWVYATHSRVSASAVVSADGVAIFGARNGVLYALDTHDGSRLWSYRTTEAPRKANLDASPALGPDGIVTVGAYNGLVTRLPVEYPLSHRQDPRVAVGGHEDQPYQGGPLGADEVKLRLQTRDGRLLDAPEGPVGRSPLLRLKLVANRGGQARENLALNPGLSVRLEPPAPLEATLASDGRSLNVAATGFLQPDTRYQLVVSGEYRERADAWWFDRLLPRSAGRFTTRLPLESGPVTAAPAGAVSWGAVSWGAKELYLFQPEALDTYTPAALDGQAFVLVRCPSAGAEGVVVGVPALPVTAGVRPLAEPGRVFALDAAMAGASLRAVGAFALSAMGGTIPFEHVVMTARADGQGLHEGEMLAIAPLWGLRGNGSSFSFPPGLLNEVADHGLRLVAQGTFEGCGVVGAGPQWVADRPIRGAEAAVRWPDREVAAPTLRVAVASRGGKLVAIAAQRVEGWRLGGPLTLVPVAGRRLAEADRLQLFEIAEPS